MHERRTAAGLIVVANLIAAGSGIAMAADADTIAKGIAHAAAVAMFCSEKTQGEVGAPTPVIATYFREASAKYAAQFGKPLTQVADYNAATHAVRDDPSWISAATRDEWPDTCDTELDRLTNASRGDFTGWNN